MSKLTYTNKMRLEHFHDFYFLQALKAGIANEISANPEKAFSRSVEKLSNNLDEAIEEIVPNMALRTFVYLYAACFGEARHAREEAAELRYMPCTLTMHRAGMYTMITDYRPTMQNLNTLIHVFDQDWRSGFGGQAWCKIARALKMYFTDPPTAFIDHVIDLEHNGGTAFNKMETKDTLGFVPWYPVRLSSFLDYKFARNILAVGPDFLEKLKVTPRVYKLVNRYTSIFGKTQVDWITPELDTLGEYMIEWSDEVMTEEEKWGKWANVSYGNSPHFSELVQKTGIDDVYASQFTKSELQTKAAEFKAKAFELAGTFLTRKLKAQISRKINRWLDWAIQNCKVEKKSVTYQAIPVKIRKLQGSLFEIEALVPYDGYGVKTENGFKFQEALYGVYSHCAEGHIQYNDYLTCLMSRHQTYSFTDKQLEAFLD